MVECLLIGHFVAEVNTRKHFWGKQLAEFAITELKVSFLVKYLNFVLGWGELKR
jgi:hypothetical protein